jgi:Spy/CpxP family protein refolding chaperone
MKCKQAGIVLAAACAAAIVLGWAVAATAAPESAPGRFVLVQEGGPSVPPPANDGRMREGTVIRQSLVARQLVDPLVRSEIGLTADQEAKIAELQKKIQTTLERLQDRARLDWGTEEPTENLSPNEQWDRRREALQALVEDFRAIRPELEAMLKDINGSLTEEQLEKLKTLGQEREQFGGVGGDLWILVTTRVKEDLGLSDEQVGQIREYLKAGAAKLTEARKTTSAADEGAAPEDRAKALRERIDAFKQQQTQLAAETREQVLGVLTPEQRAKAEERLKQRDEAQKAQMEQVRNLFGGMVGGGPPGGGGGPGGPPGGEQGGRN